MLTQLGLLVVFNILLQNAKVGLLGRFSGTSGAIGLSFCIMYVRFLFTNAFSIVHSLSVYRFHCFRAELRVA